MKILLSIIFVLFLQNSSISIYSEDIQISPIYENDGSSPINLTQLFGVTNVSIAEQNSTEIELEVNNFQSEIDKFITLTSIYIKGFAVHRDLTSIEDSLNSSLVQHETAQMKEIHAIEKIRALQLKVGNIRTALHTLDSHIKSLASENEVTTMPKQHKSWATLYYNSGLTGRSSVLDFRNCSLEEDCCQNLMDLEIDNNSRSIDVHYTCVRLYIGYNCVGEYQEFYPPSNRYHLDFGTFNDNFSSGKPCKRSN